MSNTYSSKNVKMVDRTLVEKILEQGQKLRNSMVECILNNDPLYNMEVIYDKHCNSPKSSASELVCTNVFSEGMDNVYFPDSKRLEAFLRGDYLTKDEERLALKTVRSMSATDICKATERTLSSRINCKCFTCSEYNVDNLKCDLRRTAEAETITRHIQNKYKTECLCFLKYVDSMKVTVYNIVLNAIGIRKVFLLDKSSGLRDSVSQNYFIEYRIPDSIKTSSKKSKVDSGLENNHIKICSRSSSEVINVKQTFIHEVTNLEKLSLDDVQISFKISYRNQKQKTSCLLGFAKFCFKGFEISKNLTCIRGLAIHLTENSPLVAGTLKVSFQLGCGKSYFGKEFIENVTSNKQSSVVLDSDDIGSDQFIVEEENSLDLPVKDIKNVKNRASHNINLNENCKCNESNRIIDVNKQVPQKTVIEKPLASQEPVQIIEPIKEHSVSKYRLTENEKQILFGFVYISEAQYFTGSKSTYLTCRPFSQEETSISRLVVNSASPIFMFFQNIPLLYEDGLLAQLRENYMVIEFWEKTDTSNVIFGLSKIDLHQFYLAYRNPVISKHLRDNKLPVIGSDWWEPIYNLNDDELLGQVQILTALGTEQQVQQLKLERGFNNDMVKAKLSTVQDRKATDSIKYSRYSSDKIKINNSLVQKTNRCKSIQTNNKDSKDNKPKEVDIGVQVGADVTMDSKEDPKKGSSTQEMIGSFLNQILALKQKNVCVENSTNTDPSSTTEFTNNDPNIQKAQGSTTAEVRNTSDLLKSLQTALAVETNQQKTPSSSTFKALISVNNANHLPSRKKFKSKKMRGRSAKHDENVLPSTYVTFETLEHSSLNITPVVPKCTAPRWDYKCEVKLPVDLLTNNQKRLIFKVWKKSTNTVMQPNLQTDTVLGFAAVDLTVLLAGLPNVQGWFNIIDFSGKCNGQINVHVTPLENLSKWNTQTIAGNKCVNSTIPDDQTALSDEPGEVLSRALKRKFTELDEITQRLRLRLSEVTTEDSEGSNDDATDEFERDINTLCVEDDFDLINFEDEARKFSANHNRNIESKNEAHLISIASGGIKDPQTSTQHDPVQNKDQQSSSTSNSDFQKELVLDQQLLQGKQRIDTLLEKLTLISSDTSNIFSNRYVSGCSATTENVDTEGILKDLDHFSRPNIQGVQSFDPLSFQQLYGSSMYSVSGSNSNSNNLLTPCSEESVKSDCSDCRVTPDGEGNSTDDKK